MLISENEINIIDEYIQENNNLKQYFMEGSEEIKEQISRNIADKICDKIYNTRQCALPNERDLQEKITMIMDDITSNYYQEIEGYVRLQHSKIDQATTRINDNQLEFDQSLILDTLSHSVNYSKIELEQDVVSKISDSLNNHIAFRNHSNLNYSNFKFEIEDYIRKEVRNKMELFSEELDNLYENIINQLNEKRNSITNTISSFEHTNQQTISQNEVEISNKQGRTLDPNIFFDSNEEYYQSENYKRFL